MKHTTLQKLRDKRHLTNAEVSRRALCSESMVSKVLSGEKKRGKVRDRIVQVLSESQQVN